MSSTLVGGPVANEAANIQPEPGRNEVVDKPVGDTAIVSVKNDTKLLPESLTPSATGAAQEVNVGPTSADTVTASETRAHVEREEQATKEVQVSAAAYNRSNSGPESSSQASAEANVNAQTQSADANTENGSANDGGMVMQAVEEQASTRHDSRPNYVVSQATTTSNMANSAESSSRIVEEITQAPPPMSYSRRRVKVYALNSSGNWFDRGTGMVDIRGWDTDPTIIVINENDPNDILIESYILLGDAYHRQQDSLIVWNEASEDSPEGVDLAISFQEAAGCTDIWDRIVECQARMARMRGFSRPGLGGSGAGSFDDLFCKSDDEDEGLQHPGAGVRLPAPKIKNVDAILQVIAENFLAGKLRLVSAICKENYITELCDLFKMAEDLGNIPTLEKLFEIFKLLIMLAQPRVANILFQPEHVFQMMGALEYDPDIAPSRRPKHRHFLENVVVFHQVIALPAHIVEQIHRSFRLQYLKDVVLPRILDEATFAFLNSMIMFGNNKIVADIRAEPRILPDLFAKMKNVNTSPEQLKDLLRFLHELCELSKHTDPDAKVAFYASLHELGLLEVLSRTLHSSEMSLISVEILLASVDTDGRLLRKHLMKNAGAESLLSTLIKRLHEDEDTAVKNVITDLLRFLVDVESLEDANERNDFLQMFYTHHLDHLLSPILVHNAQPGIIMKDSTSLLTLNLIEFVGFLLMHHGSHAKNHIVRYKILTRMNPLVSYVDKAISLAAVRNLRLVIGLRDKDLNKQLIRDNLLDRVVKLFLTNSSRYNLINSACLELFTQLRKDAKPATISYFVTRYYDQLKHISYTDVFALFKIAYDEQKDPSYHYPDTPDTPPLVYSGSSNMGRTGPSSLASDENERFQIDMDELDYFESGLEPPVTATSHTLNEDMEYYPPRGHGLGRTTHYEPMLISSSRGANSASLSDLSASLSTVAEAATKVSSSGSLESGQTSTSAVSTHATAPSLVAAPSSHPVTSGAEAQAESHVSRLTTENGASDASTTTSEVTAAPSEGTPLPSPRLSALLHSSRLEDDAISAENVYKKRKSPAFDEEDAAVYPASKRPKKSGELAEPAL